jgi:hypothetical protein
MRNINIDTWKSGMRIVVFPWIDSKNLYMHIEYYRSGARKNDPTWEKSILINPTDKAYDALENRLDTFANAVASMRNTGLNMVLNVE